MAQVIRQQINGVTPQDIRKINDNTEAIWEKVHGDINFGNTDADVQTKLLTQWIPVQGEGNFDSNIAYDVRFYIPPNVTKVKSTSFNLNVTNYRMDSDIAMAQEQNVPVSISSSVSSETISCSVESFVQSSPVKTWYGWSNVGAGITPPTKAIVQTPNTGWDLLVSHGFYRNYSSSEPSEYALGINAQDAFNTNDYPLKIVDMKSFNHIHDISHGHSFFQSPHGHTITGSVTIPPHTHDLREGIKVSATAPQGVMVTLNGVSIATMSSGNPSISSLDVKDHINIGAWNTIHCTTSNLARMVFYGIIEIELKNMG